ncbi:hypothetical protein DSO57_1030072 [Entomophthora muscae]|nr:hypothetical protein DSO57_1030072 [Entomophthora muscae]
MALPLSGMFVFRYIYPYPMNNIFLASLKNISIPHYEALSQRDYRLNYWDELRDSASRSYKRIKNIVLVVALSFIPRVGVFVLPIASFYLTSKSVGLTLSLMLSALPLTVPGTKSYIVWFLSTIYGTRSLSRELLEPYFGRLGFTAKERVEYFKQRESILLGFSLGYYLLISNIPIFGPVFYVFAQSATATFIIKTSTALEYLPTEKAPLPETKTD